MTVATDRSDLDAPNQQRAVSAVDGDDVDRTRTGTTGGGKLDIGPTSVTGW